MLTQAQPHEAGCTQASGCRERNNGLMVEAPARRPATGLRFIPAINAGGRLGALIAVEMFRRASAPYVSTTAAEKQRCGAELRSPDVLRRMS